jgi:prepilin-type N-terminal cleavage/methylation domain-containing protein
MKHQHPGFTLIELLTVMAIVGLLTAIAVPSYAAIRNSVAFSGAADELVNNLRTTQSQAITSQGGSTAIHRVQYVDNAHYKIINGVTEVGVALPNGIVFNSNWEDFDFTRLFGTTTDIFGVPINTPRLIILHGSHDKTITIDANGRIS